MSWNIAAECVSLVFLTIIWSYSHRRNVVPSFKNKLFQFCFLATFIAILTNIISTICIDNISIYPIWLTLLATNIYFLFTPLMGLAYCLYTVSYIYPDTRHVIKIMIPWLIPAFLYILVIITNSFTHYVFTISHEGYFQGPYIISTYLIFYAYAILALIFALVNYKKIDRKILYILCTFPLIALSVIIFQQVYPTIILTGSAATSSLLIIYLYLQNKQITTDYLTDLPNRVELIDTMELLMNKYNKSFTITTISLREFRQLNDAFGRQVGDQLLKDIAYYLNKLLEYDCVYRFSGDEFALLIKDKDEDTFRRLLNTILERFNQPWTVQKTSIHMQCVIGAANYPNSAKSIENIINAIEHATAKAKILKQDKICYCDQSMFDDLQRKNEIIQALSRAIHTKSFEMYYQPIICIKSNKFEYAESLMRLSDEKLGAISPIEFIPIAEESGLITDLTYIILDKVCKFINQLEKENIPIHAIHVNFSALQFKQSDLIDRIIEIIENNHTPFHKIKIEFTESAIAESTEAVVEFTNQARKIGLLMGLDDFETGYSNFNTVMTIPFSTIKLDKSLVWGAFKRKRNAIAVEKIIDLFKALNINMVAEGIETEEQSKFIIESGIDQIQGYYYAKPMPKEQFIEFIKEHMK